RSRANSCARFTSLTPADESPAGGGSDGASALTPGASTGGIAMTPEVAGAALGSAFGAVSADVPRTPRDSPGASTPFAVTPAAAPTTSAGADQRRNLDTHGVTPSPLAAIAARPPLVAAPASPAPPRGAAWETAAASPAPDVDSALVTAD